MYLYFRGIVLSEYELCISTFIPYKVTPTRIIHFVIEILLQNATWPQYKYR